MASQFQIEDDTWGTLSIFAIRVNEDGTWEDEWDALRQAELEGVIDLLSEISYDTYFELRYGHVQPFLQEVGLGPENALTKLEDEYSICHYKDSCPSFDPEACGAHLSPPPCYDANADDDVARPLVTRLFDLWRFGFHVILVQPENL